MIPAPPSSVRPDMNRILVIASTVVLLHVAGLWALQTGLLRRVVEIVVPVEILSDLISPPAPRVDVPRPTTPPIAAPQPRQVVPRPATQAVPQPLAIADPTNVSAIDEISFRTGCVVRTAVASARAIHQAIQRYYGEQEAVPGTPEVDTQQLRIKEKFPTTKIDAFDTLLARVVGHGEVAEEEVDVLASLDQDHPATKFLLDVLAIAVERGIPEIQIEPSGQEYRVRFRLHGMLHQYMTIPEQVGRGIATRLRKLIPRGDPASLSKKEHPLWIGSFYTSHIKGKPLTVLVSFYPTLSGETILVKIANGSTLKPLEHLGITPKSQKVLQRMLAKSEGLLVLVSPPGQGKTTTLYAILQQFDRSGMNILTLEHPVELLLPGMTQISVNPQMSYRNWYSLIAYNNPDLLAIENMDHALMAQLALELASSTLVLASLTAANLADGLYTCLALLSSVLRPAHGLSREKRWQEADLLLESLNGIVSQRLIRTICPHCKEEAPVSVQTAELIQWLTAEVQNAGQFPVYTGRGCQECMGTGYGGQTGIFEVLKLDKQVKQFLLQAQPISAFQLRPGLIDLPAETLKQQGLQKLRDGVTSPAEIRRVLQPAI